MDVRLIRVQEDGGTAELPLKHSKTVFGRAPECTVRVPSASVSRTHCEVSVTKDGSITVRDLGSSNGTYVNQERIEQRPVTAGDLISFGGFVFVVRVNGEPEEIDPELMFEDGIPEAEAPVPARAGPDQPTSTGGGVPAGVPRKASADLEESSVVDFDFDFDDDEEQQPPL